MKVVNQSVHLPVLAKRKVSLSLKREDQIHPYVSGNKYRKLKYNLQEVKRQGLNTILTFGGAYSNHISATAYACRAHGLRTIGVIRGEEIAERWEKNPTLVAAKQQGMELHFISREQYHEKAEADFLESLRKKFGAFYLMPEGGTNNLAVKGCEEILTGEDALFDIITGCVGTGGTLAGIINSSGLQQQILGFPALKGNFLHKDIRKFVHKNNWDLVLDYHFGGYAKENRELINFINWFKRETGIPLDPIYTGKMIFGVLDLVKKSYFRPGTKILAIHSGGLQGIAGMNIVLKKKNLPLIDI
ncbi:1-aminocyclopropane-1-carboxylate deaminase/D-cysteine desulfhydrase [Spongiimicrobium sp. 2-473A-2-J]|uniref:1-aminocyclopropane-1-carboxylate deaminase/D-cysteine desulfhydrase n=1 Tax=Eudoraea algarum TaxID=3417568 RepID=UPI003D36198E